MSDNNEIVELVKDLIVNTYIQAQNKKIEKLEQKIEDLGKFLGFGGSRDINGLGRIKTTIEAYAYDLFGKRIEQLEQKIGSIPLANDVKLALKDNIDKALDLIEANKEKIEELEKQFNDNKLFLKVSDAVIGLEKRIEKLEKKLSDEKKTVESTKVYTEVVADIIKNDSKPDSFHKPVVNLKSCKEDYGLQPYTSKDQAIFDKYYKPKNEKPEEPNDIIKQTIDFEKQLKILCPNHVLVLKEDLEKIKNLLIDGHVLGAITRIRILLGEQQYEQPRGT